MRIVIYGWTLSGRHEIVRVGVRSGDVQCDYTDRGSVRDMFKKTGEFDSLISVVGDRTQVHPREVFADPITDRASAIIVAHNHPSGGLTPSKEDIEVTKRLTINNLNNSMGLISEFCSSIHHEIYLF